MTEVNLSEPDSSFGSGAGDGLEGVGGGKVYENVSL